MNREELKNHAIETRKLKEQIITRSNLPAWKQRFVLDFVDMVIQTMMAFESKRDWTMMDTFIKCVRFFFKRFDEVKEDVKRVCAEIDAQDQAQGDNPTGLVLPDLDQLLKPFKPNNNRLAQFGFDEEPSGNN